MGSSRKSGGARRGSWPRFRGMALSTPYGVEGVEYAWVPESELSLSYGCIAGWLPHRNRREVIALSASGSVQTTLVCPRLEPFCASDRLVGMPEEYVQDVKNDIEGRRANGHEETIYGLCAMWDEGMCLCTANEPGARAWESCPVFSVGAEFFRLAMDVGVVNDAG